MGAHRAGDGPHPGTARELQAIIHAEREGMPFLVYRDAGEALRIAPLPTALTVGRNPAPNLSIPWDDEVSALHAISPESSVPPAQRGQSVRGACHQPAD